MSEPFENFNILIVEDNPADLFLIERMLSSSRLRINHMYSVQRISEAISLLKQHNINLVLLDLSLPDSFGMESFLRIKELAENIPVIVLTGQCDSEVAIELLQNNAQDYLVKGEFDGNLLIKSIEHSIERKKAEKSIIISEKNYRQIFYQNPFPMWISDADTREILEVNDAAIRQYGYDREEFLTLNVNDIRCDIVEDDHGPGGILRHKRKSGEVMLVECSDYPIDYFGKCAIQAIVNDVTEKIRLEKELLAQKQQIVEAVLSAQESERKTIGAELHDNINQILTALKLHLDLALDFPEKRVDFINKSISSVTLAIEEIRKLSKALISGGNLKTLGLVHSVEDLIGEILPLTNANITLTADNLVETDLSEEQKTAIYRIVQEQMNNILKYADASDINIVMYSAGEQVHLLISDNGKGFDVRLPRKGIGISNIMNRAELFNGKVSIDSAPGKGCCLDVVLNTKAVFRKVAVPS
jgi:two-component system, NarL family, sensor histidine kinase UhpB